MESTLASKPRTFISKMRNMTLVVRQPIPIRDDRNRQVGMEPQLAVEFKDHYFTANDDTAAKAGFRSVEELVDWLHDHETFNAEIWDESEPPGQEEPTVKEQARRLNAALLSHDVDSIERLIDEEKTTHNRGDVLAQAYAALETLAEGAELS